ncbi:MAG TPA: proline--tRNA ligase [Acidimicrobiia bacterium]|nr:proline--tRNA ligase [Acidimicrobiia bacterium]
MRMSQLFLRTLRDDPSDAEVDSHRLLVRAGFIRKVAAGVYSWLPLGYRVLRKVEQIVREEMDAAGAQELLLPIIQPLELWQRTGRDKAYGPLMFKLNDRKESGFALAPTAEEVITVTASNEYGSYRDLPVNLYQINWKYRDELRPRFGLLRSREFLMKDAYSFDADVEGLKASYKLMYDAYHRVFERCGLSFRPVEAQAGEIGGDVNHEFMAVAAVGEDDFVWCKSCDYAANVEAAVRQSSTATFGAKDSADISTMAPEHTPDLPGIKGVAEFLGVEPNEMLKCIAIDVDGEMGLAIVPGDREVNPFALNRALAGRKVRLWEDADFDAHPEVPKGYIGPHFSGATVRVADPAVGVPNTDGWVTGANEVDHHVRHAVLGRDFDVDTFADLVTVVTGDPCPNCGSPLSVNRGIEVGHTFQLGTKYSVALGAEYTDETGQQHPMVMGCYGIGVSRVVAAVVEEHHDENGLAWPAALAPYQVHLISLPGKGEAAPEVRAAADRLYDELRAAGVDVLYDDRDQSPGVKFADADLLGVPTQLVLGGKGLARGVVERKDRSSGERDEVALETVVGVVSGG